MRNQYKVLSEKYELIGEESLNLDKDIDKIALKLFNNNEEQLKAFTIWLFANWNAMDYNRDTLQDWFWGRVGDYEYDQPDEDAEQLSYKLLLKEIERWKDYLKAQEVYKQGTQATGGDWDIKGLTENVTKDFNIEWDIEQLVFETLLCKTKECFLEKLKNSRFYPLYFHWIPYDKRSDYETVQEFKKTANEVIKKVFKKLSWPAGIEKYNPVLYYFSLFSASMHYLGGAYLYSLNKNENSPRDYYKTFLQVWNQWWPYFGEHAEAVIADYKKAQEVYKQGTQSTGGDWDIKGLTEAYTYAYDEVKELSLRVLECDYIEQVENLVKKFIEDFPDYFFQPEPLMDPVLDLCKEGDIPTYKRKNTKEYYESIPWNLVHTIWYVSMVVGLEVRSPGKKKPKRSKSDREYDNMLAIRAKDYWEKTKLKREEWKDWKKAQEVYKQGTQATGGEWDIKGLT